MVKGRVVMCMINVNIIGSDILASSLNKAVAAAQYLIKRKKTCYICFSNAHTLVEGKRNKRLRDITNGSAMALADGMPLVWVQRMRGLKDIGRCAGPDFMDEFLKQSIGKRYSHYFVGWDANTLDLLVKKLAWKYPGLEIAGTGIAGIGVSDTGTANTDTGTTGEGDEQYGFDEGIAEEINMQKPDVVWIGLGFPKQEMWMHEHVKKIECAVLIGVGAAFNFHAGIVKRAPLLMQRLGLEWLYRICQEPARLWKRYIVTNTLFIYYLIVDFLERLNA